MQDAGRESAPANRTPQTEKQDEERQKASTVIYDITNACFDTFEDLVLSADADSSLGQEQEQALVSDAPSSEELSRDIRGLRNGFAFWIDYTGALAPVGASLDDRLHSHDDIQEMVVELLEMVEKNLGRRELPGLLDPSDLDIMADCCLCGNSAAKQGRKCHVSKCRLTTLVACDRFGARQVAFLG